MFEHSKRAIFLIAAGILLARGASAQPLQSVEWRLQVKSDVALVRAAPDAGGAVLLTLAKGTMVPSFEKLGEWFRVVVEAGEGGLTEIGFLAASDVEVMKAIVRSVGDFWTEETGEFHGLGLSVKVFAGAGFPYGGDVSRASRGMFLASADEILGHGYETYARVEEFGFKGLELNLDVLYRLTSRLSVGIGTGSLDASGEGFLGYFDSTGSVARLQTKPVLHITPFRLALTYTLPIHKLFNIYAHAGPAYYRAKISHQLMLAAPGYSVNVGELGTSRAFGVHGGLGLELVLTSRGCWFVEVQGRYARFKDFKGEMAYLATAPFVLPVRDSAEGGLYYTHHERYARLDVLAGSPAEGSGSRSLVYEMRSVSALTGIRLKF